MPLYNDDNSVKENLEVHFCYPVKQNEYDEKKRSLVFLRNTKTTDKQLKRAARLTSGEINFESKNVIRNENGYIAGIILVAKKSSDESKSAFCKDTTRWTISFNIICSPSETGALRYDNLSLAKKNYD